MCRNICFHDLHSLRQGAILNSYYLNMIMIIAGKICGERRMNKLSMHFNDRLIFHCDCNNFFASCECLDMPELKSVPLAVAGDPERRTGIVVAKNDLAKQYGVRTTDTVWQARQKCPEIVFVPPRHSYYHEISERINAIYREFTAYVEPASVDESYLDMTGVPQYMRLSPMDLANHLRERIKHEIGVTISIGVSFNKVFAKLGSDYKKPDAVTLITKDNFRDILWPLPVSDMLYVGHSMQQLLHARGIETIGQLASTPPSLLTAWIGKGGEQLWQNANGLNREPVRFFDDKTEIKSVSRGATFDHDLTELEEIRHALSPLADEVATALRKHSLKGSVIQLQIKDPELHTISRQITLERPTFLYREIMDTVMHLLCSHWPVHKKAPIRAMTVGAVHLIPASEVSEQLSLFSEPEASQHRENLENLEKAIDKIREKLGDKAITFGFQAHQKDD